MCLACHVARRVFCRSAYNPAIAFAPARTCLACHRSLAVPRYWFISLEGHRAVHCARKAPESSPPTTVTPEEPKSSGRNLSLSDADLEARLATVAYQEGKRLALSLHKRYKKNGYVTTQRTLRALLSESFDTELLEFYEKALCLKADATVWAKLVHNASVKSSAATAVALYETALKSGVRPSTALLHPVLRALCSGSLRPPTEASIDRAIDLYRQFTKVHQDAESIPGDGPTSDAAQDQTEEGRRKSNVPTPDIAIYNTLLRAVASSANIKKYFPIALSLVEDLHSRDLAIDAMTSTSLIVLLMRTSPTYKEAYEAYRSFTQSGKHHLDAKGYAAVLHTFYHRVPSTQIPSAHLFFQIIKDMRAAGFPASAEVYNMVLQRLAIFASKISANAKVPLEDRQAELTRVAAQIKHVHQALRLDSLTPDTKLWTQLMDTYQRAQCFEDALSIWDIMYHSSLHDNASVSVILDACAYANAYGRATKIWDDLTATRFPLNMRHWKAWLECLCRMGRFEEALKVLCIEMDAWRGQYKIAPDVECARIILSFASPKNEQEVVLERIKQYLPEIWRKL
ncbi:uncharacterized protein C8Q71DRAFT_834002 [Rhodofomes roseus]|uniref:Uncharacterized protein n=1 Tax=Rhodofomes roseus TaxID=34475 RepID=A0ABQ8KHU2_9APHY|nr:uncharacterized protein C8Q71DRAFT_834002 [Rhodofomes roseus]KAH9836938.1 hypothetical protein C8Q71DRAFT_834002 [Rhodofomes roseus]